MCKLLTAIAMGCLIGCNNQSHSTDKTAQSDVTEKTDTAYTWSKLLDSAPWEKSYNFQLFSNRDTLWTFHSDGTWFSTDGQHWNPSPLPNAINNLAFLDYLPFNGAMYGLGYLEGNIERFHFSPTIYSTQNFRNWQIVATHSNLPLRFFYHPFVFNNKIWLIGGEDKNTQYADVWNSPDGITWAKQKDSLPFGKRSNSQVVQLKDKLFLLNNDVWSSTDGLNWQQETPAILPGEQVFGYAALVWDDKIWLIGCNRNGLFSSQVLVSNDGKSWQGQQAPWTPRGGVAATVYKDAIYMTGGKYGGTPNEPDFRYSNDVWVLTKTSKPSQ